MKKNVLITLLLITAISFTLAACITEDSWAVQEQIEDETAAVIKHDVIVAFGDSLTYSVFLEGGEHDATNGLWVRTLNEEFGLGIINKGVGGANSNQARSVFQTDVLDLNPDLVLICLGMNDSALARPDMHVEKEQFKDNIEFMVDSLLETGASVILITPNYIDDAKYYQRHDPAVFESVGGIVAFSDSYFQILRDIAEVKDGVFLADVRVAFDAFEDKNEVLFDGVHQTERGQQVYSDTVGALFERLGIQRK